MSPSSPRRSGMALVIALAAIITLSIVAFAVHLLRQHSYKTLEFIDGYFRAVSVGEACHARVVARLQGKPWSERWFAGKVSSGEGTFEGGSYEYLIGDSPSAPTAQEADLLVWAIYGRREVSMFWRLKSAPYSLSPFREVRTTIFTHLDPVQAPVGAGIGPVSAAVDQMVQQRDTNAPWQQTIRGQLQAAPGLTGPFTTLGIPQTGVLMAEIPPAVPGSPTVPLDPSQAATGPSTSPTVPASPSPPVVVLDNGGFEGSGGWTPSTVGGTDAPSINMAATDGPYSGNSYAKLTNKLGNMGNPRSACLEQSFTVPPTASTLSYAIKYSCDNWGAPVGLRINGTSVKSVSPSGSALSGGWTVETYDITAYRGQNVTVQIYLEDQSTEWAGNVDHGAWVGIDDIGVQ